MKKFLVVVKREYVQRVRSRFFVVATILGPVLMAGFAIVPALMFGIKSGGPTRLAVVDQTGKMYERVAKELQSDRGLRGQSQPAKPEEPPGLNNDPRERAKQNGNMMQGSFAVEEVKLEGRSVDDVRKDLDARVSHKQIEGYIILPPNLLQNGQPEFSARNAADLFTQSKVENSINRALRSQRMVENGIDEKKIEKMSEPVSLKTTG
ncbi:MAG TPA: hypothetical protein VN476_01235, partial [Pyrinomonadaceae bacterium]|nr:hypothetical protein [Pyrinomonadaceae bacterium]